VCWLRTNAWASSKFRFPWLLFQTEILRNTDYLQFPSSALELANSLQKDTPRIKCPHGFSIGIQFETIQLLLRTILLTSHHSLSIVLARFVGERIQNNCRIKMLVISSYVILSLDIWLHLCCCYFLNWKLIWDQSHITYLMRWDSHSIQDSPRFPWNQRTPSTRSANRWYSLLVSSQKRKRWSFGIWRPWRGTGKKQFNFKFKVSRRKWVEEN